MRSFSNLSRTILGGSIISVVVVGTLIGVASNSLFDWLHSSLGWGTGWIALGALALLFLVLIPIAALVRHALVLLRGEHNLRLTAEGKVRPAPGLIVLVSPPAAGQPVTTLAAAAAIRYHLEADAGQSLRRCWLVASPQAHDCAVELQQLYTKQPRCTVVSTADSESAAATFNAVNQIYRDARAENLRPTNIIADCTGGTKPMAAGMALAVAAQPSRRLSYIPRDPAIPPLLVRIGFFTRDEEE
jgi:CRISPR-associated protein (Cas_Cas02710)